MNLPLKLAYSQLKTNCSRTVWTLFGIILSTVLITTICGLGASGNALISSMRSYDNTFGDGFLSAGVIIIIAVLAGIVAATSIVVISNAFRISAGERVSQFGILKSIGATKRQITTAVLYESILLSAVAIPIGIVIGLVFTYFSVRVANHYLGEINALTNMMMVQIEFVLDFVISWQALLAAALVSFLTVLLSAWLPARKAARIPAIVSIRGSGEVKVKEKQLYTSPLTQRLFGAEGTLAAKNMKRNKRNFRAGVISLTVSIVLFITISSLTESADKMMEAIYPDWGASVTVDYTSQRDRNVENLFTAPITGEDVNAAAKKLREYGDAAIYGIGDNILTYTAVVPAEQFTPEMLEAYAGSERLPEYEVTVDINVVDEENYAALCELTGVPVGSTLLINRYDHNDNGNVAVFAPFLFSQQEFHLTGADGSVWNIPVHGVISAEDVPEYFLLPNVPVVRLIVPEWDYLRGSYWYASPADADGFIAYAKTAMEELFPGGQDSNAYMASGFNIRIFRTEEYAKIMNMAIIIVIIFIYVFAALLTLIGLTSVISTTSANVMMRSREFAILQSVGMTSGGIKRMLNLESVICSARSLVIGLPLGIILTYLINIPVRGMFPIPYQFPLLAVLLCIVAVFGITWVTMRFSASRLRSRSLIETIRAQSGR
jgi:putative ABC transport system permease protein